MSTQEYQIHDRLIEDDSESFLNVDHIAKTYIDVAGGQVHAIGDIAFSVKKGGFASVVGPSGCGKTTLLDIIGSLQKPTSGVVTIAGRQIRPRDMRVGVVFQEDSIFPWRRVLQNVTFGLESKGVDRETREKRGMELLELVNLKGFERSYPAELSGGMRQRVAIARALAMDPELLLLDEPFGALDEQTRFALGFELQDIWARTEITVVLITHSINEAVLLSDKVITLSDRPSHVVDEVPIDIPRPRTLDTLASEEFGRLVSRVWNGLGGNKALSERYRGDVSSDYPAGV